jgi:hypothetical protein
VPLTPLEPGSAPPATDHIDPERGGHVGRKPAANSRNRPTRLSDPDFGGLSPIAWCGRQTGLIFRPARDPAASITPAGRRDRADDGRVRDGPAPGRDAPRGAAHLASVPRSLPVPRRRAHDRSDLRVEDRRDEATGPEESRWRDRPHVLVRRYLGGTPDTAGQADPMPGPEWRGDVMPAFRP